MFLGEIYPSYVYDVKENPRVSMVDSRWEDYFISIPCHHFLNSRDKDRVEQEINL